MYYRINRKSGGLVAGGTYFGEERERERLIKNFIQSELITLDEFNKGFNFITSEEWK